MRNQAIIKIKTYKFTIQNWLIQAKSIFYWKCYDVELTFY